MGGVSRKHAAPAITRQFELGVLHRAHGAVEADCGNLIAPWIDGANAVPRTRVNDVEKRALFAHRRRVEREPTMVAA
jgi:hypothetical protein